MQHRGYDAQHVQLLANINADKAHSVHSAPVTSSIINAI
jgi:hypothetical protein